MTRLLIVEDDEPIRAALEEGFRYEGFEVEAVGDGEQALESIRLSPPDLVVLDVMLPRRSGLDVCRTLREAGNSLPIILLTARREELDKVRGLQLGADDYITKPFGFLELRARVDAVLRRTEGKRPEPTTLKLGAIEVDLERHEARRGEEPVELSPREYEILRYFGRRPRQVITRDELLRSVWGYEDSFQTRTVDMHIAKLRRKVEEDPAHPRFLLTVHGSGYQFVPRSTPD